MSSALRRMPTRSTRARRSPGQISVRSRSDPGFAGGLLLPRDVSVDNTLLVRALQVAAARAGARIDSGACATRFVVERGRVTGVESGGDRLEAGSVVVAAGAWSGEIVGPGLPALRTHPVRGQMVCLDPRGLPFRRVLSCADGYLVRRRDGRVLVGSTMEKVGFDKGVSVSGVAALKPGTPSKFGLFRRDQPLNVDVTPGLRPRPAKAPQR